MITEANTLPSGDRTERSMPTSQAGRESLGSIGIYGIIFDWEAAGVLIIPLWEGLFDGVSLAGLEVPLSLLCLAAEDFSLAGVLLALSFMAAGGGIC